MPYYDFFWTDQNVEHIAQHGITQADFEYVVCNPARQGSSQSSGRPAAWGYTQDGR